MSKKLIKASQGVHIVLDKKFLDGPHAIMVPQTSDGRVLFAVPWNESVIVGTTDTEIETIDEEPRALEKEIKFILENAGKYMTRRPKKVILKVCSLDFAPWQHQKIKMNQQKKFLDIIKFW